MSGQGKRLMVMAGGTGGHVFPGLAVAHHLMAQGWQVRWLGTADRMEADLVPKHGIEIDFIRISGLRGKGIKALIAAPLRIFNAWRQARAIMKAYKPDVVLGMGGYVSGPGGLAAWSLGIPVVLHEQNGIARGFIDLDTVFIHQDIGLESIAIPARAAHGQRHPRGIQHKVILLPTIPHVGPALLIVKIAGHAALAVMRGDHVACGQHLEVFLQRRMRADRAAHRHGRLCAHQHPHRRGAGCGGGAGEHHCD